MKKLSLFIIVLAVAATASAQSFDDYFVDRTLRADYIFSGNADTQFIALSALSKSDLWAGRNCNLDRTAVEGNGSIVVTDPTTGAVLYKHTFSSLFSEWLGMPEAKEVNRSFEFTALLPFPKQPVDVTVTLMSERREPMAVMRHRVDPTDILIRNLSSHKPTDHVYLLKNGSPEECIDVAILAEGYTADQQETFVADARRAVDAIMSYAPFERYADRFNFVAVESASKDTDVSMPSQNLWRETAVDSHFDTFYSDRYLTTGSVFAINDLLTNIPYEHIIILANTEKYGGGGIYNSYTLTNARNKYFAPVVVHEFGHSFGGLGDEYFYEHEDIATGQYCAEVEPWEPNITTLKDFDAKWRDMLPADCTVPTPETDKARKEYTLGVYEGGGYLTHGVYRPTVTCRMRDNVAPRFCPVCERAIERVILLNYSDEASSCNTNVAEVAFIENFYTSYVFGDDEFVPSGKAMCTKKLLDHLAERYDYDCPDGDCYALWTFRTGHQDGPSNQNGVTKITNAGDDWYRVEYTDMGTAGTTLVRLLDRNGQILIDELRHTDSAE